MCVGRDFGGIDEFAERCLGSVECTSEVFWDGGIIDISELPESDTYAICRRMDV